MKFDHLLLMASDLPASVSHYDRLLPAIGFERSREWVWSHEGLGLAVDLRQAEGGAYLRRGPGLNHLAFAFDSHDELKQATARVEAAGMTLPEVQEFGPARSYFLPDPDGLRLELIWDPEA
jgi:catechol 2,3-dioxygenase-like lactoylglutathione lyase family enzyme